MSRNGAEEDSGESGMGRTSTLLLFVLPIFCTSARHTQCSTYGVELEQVAAMLTKDRNT